jgi:hypothetical protein
MFVKKPIGLGLIVALAALGSMAFLASSAFGAEQLYNKKPSAGGVLLRSLTTAPKLQPDAGEFVNSTNVTLVVPELGTVTCKELEFGTTVKNNAGAGATTLALPFGVAEGDECTTVAGGVTFEVPTYFDTNEQGAVGTGATTVATATLAGANPNGKATFANLFFSQHLPTGEWCRSKFGGVTAAIANGTEPFGEEGGSGLTATFTNALLPIEEAESGLCAKQKGKNFTLNGTFRLETPSTGTDGWWYE